MRVLMLSQFYPPFIGGEERMVYALSTALAERGHDVSVATLWHDGQAEREVDRGVTIYRLRGLAQRIPLLYSDPLRRHAPPFPDPEASLALAKVVREERPQIVHAHNWMLHAYAPLAVRSRAKLVVSLHDYSFTCPTKKFIEYGTYDAVCPGPSPRRCLRCARHHYGLAKGAFTVSAAGVMRAVEERLVDLFVPVSMATAEAAGLPGSRLPWEMIPDFLAPPQAGDGAQPDLAGYLAQLPPDGYLMFAGAAGEYKGISVLLRAYEQLADPPPLVLLGYSTSEHQGDAAPLPAGVMTLANWPHAAVMEAWRRCAVAVAPSRWGETFGLVALEAMSVGRPVVASRIGGLQEVVADGETGLLVPPGDVAALRDALARLLADPDLRERLGAAGRARATRFTAQVVVPRFERAYGALLDGCAR